LYFIRIKKIKNKENMKKNKGMKMEKIQMFKNKNNKKYI